ncbi:U-box domain-containing protein [Cryptosporidium serpentis]
MSLICSISGALARDPVISKTGYIFERKLIEEYVKSNGKCPFSNDALAVDDLISIHTDSGITPRLPANTSIPGLLEMLQTEWDATMTELFQLRLQVDQLKMQLSQSLYQQDAACRVIAKLIKERDSARKDLEEIQNRILENPPINISRSTEESANDRKDEILQEYDGISMSLVDEYIKYADTMRPLRKKREFVNLASPMDLKSLDHSRLSFKLGSKSSNVLLECSQLYKNKVIITGHSDGDMYLTDTQKGDSICRIESKACTSILSLLAIQSVNFDVNIPGSIIVSNSGDTGILLYSLTGTVNLENKSDLYTLKSSIFLGSKTATEFSNLSAHPLNKQFLANSKKQSLFSYIDIETSKAICTQHLSDNVSYNYASFHPDGLIIGGIFDGGEVIDIWDIRNMNIATQLKEQLGIPKNNCSDKLQLCFSNNGYYLFSTTSNGSILLWDLRKGSVLQNIENTTNNRNNRFISLDDSGKYIGSGWNKKISLFTFNTKTSIEEFVTLHCNSKSSINYISFGEYANSIISTYSDSTIDIWHL